MLIGLYDSGLGGLTILKAVTDVLPDYNYLYYGDTANLPLGDKTETEVYEHTKTGVRYLFEQGASLVIIACNTASCETLRKLQDTFLLEKYPDRRILGVIVPTIEALLDSGAKNALLIATKRTVESGKYHFELGKRGAEQLRLHTRANRTLVPLIESGNVTESLRVAKGTVAETEAEVGEVDAIVLGCTHYTVLAEALREQYGQSKVILTQTEIIPEKLKEYLARHQEIKTKLTRDKSRTIHLTAHRGDYDQIIAELLGGSFIARE